MAKKSEFIKKNSSIFPIKLKKLAEIMLHISNIDIKNLVTMIKIKSTT